MCLLPQVAVTAGCPHVSELSVPGPSSVLTDILALVPRNEADNRLRGPRQHSKAIATPRTGWGEDPPLPQQTLAAWGGVKPPWDPSWPQVL